MRSCALPLLVLGACAPARSPAYATMQSAAEGRDMAYAIYTPPGFDGRTALPLVVLLHGGGDDERVLDEHRAVTRRLDEWIEAGRLPPFVMAVPDGERGFWTNWYDGTHRYEDWVIDDLVSQVRADYPILPGRDNLHLMGISMGGAGTMYIALHRRDAIASATVLSAPLFDVEQTLDFLATGFRGAPLARIFGPPERARVERDNVFSQLRTPADLRGLSLLLGAGSGDLPGILGTTHRLHDHLERGAVPHHYLVYRGGHRWSDWARIFPVALCLHMRGSACRHPEDPFYRLDDSGGIGRPPSKRG